MKTKLLFSALAVTAIIWATAAGALHHSAQNQLAEGPGDAGWSITETGAAPGWSITPAHARMW